MGWMDDYDQSKGWTGGGSANGKSKASTYKRCWEENHKPLEFGQGVVLGAACAHPADGYDIYVGFDHGMKFKHTAYPWENENDPVIEFLFPITDMCAPKDAARFKKMIEWLAAQLDDGAKVHMGCIGGHGRTGLVLAALRAHMYGEKDAIQWVRKHHCKKGVESQSQVKFLMRHYKVSKAEPTKQSHSSSTSSYPAKKGSSYGSGISHRNGSASVKSVKSSGSIW